MPELPSAIAMEHLFDVSVELDAPQMVGETPLGRRMVLILKSGAFTGARLRGEILPGGGDWLLFLPNGSMDLDVRATMRTDDGALILLNFNGIVHGPPGVLPRVLGGEDVPADEYYARISLRFETGAEPYAWMNKLIAIGSGYLGARRAGFAVFAIA